MAIIASDDFARPDNPSSLGTATTGQVWAQPLGTWGIATNTAFRDSTLSNTGIAIIDTGFTDAIVKVTLVNPTSVAFGAGSMGIVLRYFDASHYWHLAYEKFPGANRVRLHRTFGGTTTVIDVAITLSANDTISCAFCGPNFEVFVNDISQGIYDDSSNPQLYGTNCGLWGNQGTLGGGGDPRFDDFLVTTNGTCTPTYNCTGGACVDPGDGSGLFATLDACLSACSVAESYNCVDGVCVDPGDGTGTFATLLECQNSGCGAPEPPPPFETLRFDSGEGTQWYLVSPPSDGGQELRGKNLKTMRGTGKFTNTSMKAYGYNIGDEINTDDLEAGTNASTRAQPLPDSTNVAQSPRKPINVTGAVLSCLRIEGDDRGQTRRDEVHELVSEWSIQDARR